MLLGYHIQINLCLFTTNIILSIFGFGKIKTREEGGN